MIFIMPVPKKITGKMSFLLNRHCVCLWVVIVTSIPLHGVGITTALVVFERVGKRGGIATE